MNNWQKYRNFRQYQNADGSFTCVITVDGEKVEVSKEVYKAYAKYGYKMENMELGLKRDRVHKGADGKAVIGKDGHPVMLPEREVSLDKLIDEDWDYPADECQPEAAVLRQIEIEELRRCLALLNGGERALIQALFFEGATERDYAEKLGLSKTALHARKVSVLKKIKKLMS